MSAEIPVQFTHSVKLEQTAQGLRIHVHVYANDRKTAIIEAFGIYLDAVEVAKDNVLPIAPMEIKQPKDNGKK